MGDTVILTNITITITTVITGITTVTGEEGSLVMAGTASQYHNSTSYVAANTAAAAATAAAASAPLEAQLHAAEQQAQELQSQLHHKDMRVANAEAAQRSAESERDAVAQENAKLEEHVLRHQQVETMVKCAQAKAISHAITELGSPWQLWSSVEWFGQL